MSAGCEQCGRPLSTYSKEDETTCSDGEDCLGYRLGRATARITALSRLLEEAAYWLTPPQAMNGHIKRERTKIANRIRTALTGGTEGGGP